jgi:hypothetical protein
MPDRFWTAGGAVAAGADPATLDADRSSVTLAMGTCSSNETKDVETEDRDRSARSAAIRRAC